MPIETTTRPTASRFQLRDLPEDDLVPWRPPPGHHRGHGSSAQPESPATAAPPQQEATPSVLASLLPAAHETDIDPQRWQLPVPVANSLSALPSPPVVVPDDAPADSQAYAVPDGSDPGDRTADYAFMARHEAFAQRMEAQWAQISELSQRMVRTACGAFTFASEMEADFLQDQIRWETEQAQADQDSASAWSGDSVPDESAAETARLSRQNAGLTASQPASLASAGSLPLEPPAERPVAWFSPEWTVDIASAAQTVIVTGERMLTDAQGNQLQQDAQGNSVLWLQEGGLVSLGNLGSAMHAELASAVAAGVSLPGRLGAGVVANSGAGTLADALAAGSRLGSGLTARAVPVLSGPVGLAAGLLAPGVIGRSEDIALLNTLRFERNSDEAWGRLRELNPVTGEWETVAERVLVSTGVGYVQVLTEDQVRALSPAISTPAAPPAPSSPPPTPLPGWAERHEVVPPYRAAPAPGPAIESYPSAPAQDWRDTLIERRDREILGANLEGAGKPRPAGYEAHHIVPTRDGDARMDALRQQLSDLGLNLNDAANGVWLPGSNAPADAPEAYHRKLANYDYNDAVIDELRGITTLPEAQSALARIADKLRQGGDAFPGIRPRT